MTFATSSSTWSCALASAPRARSSVRSTWKRANGTARSSSARIRSAPPSPPRCRPGRSRTGAGRRAARAGSAAPRRRAPRPAGPPRRRRGTAGASGARLPSSAACSRGQRRAHRRHRVGEARLVQRDHVRVALGEDHRAGLGGGGARDVDAEQLAALREDLALARVDVLRPLAVAHRPRPEAAHAPAAVGQREHDLAAEDVVDPPLAAADGQPGGEDLLVRVARPPRGVQDRVPRRRRVADAELAQRALAQPAAEQVRARVGGLACDSHSTRT